MNSLTGRFPYGYKEPEDIVIDARQLSVWPLLESVGVSAAGTLSVVFFAFVLRPLMSLNRSGLACAHALVGPTSTHDCD